MLPQIGRQLKKICFSCFSIRVFFIARSKHTVEQKLNILRMLESKIYTIQELAETHSVKDMWFK